MEKNKLNFTLDAATCVAFLGTASTGLLFRFVFPVGPGSQTFTWLGLARPAWAALHHISFCMMLAGISLHLALHWKWILRMVRTSFEAVIARLRLESRGLKGISIQEWFG